MSELNFELLKRLCETPGVSGREDPIREIVTEELRSLSDEVRVDVMGNVIGIKNGDPNAPRVMIAAHIDEIGFIVRHVDDKGFLRLHPIGGWDPRAMMAQRVLVHGHAGQTLRGVLMPAVKPIHLQTGDEKDNKFKVEQFFVDLGLPVEKVKELVEIGDPVTMDRTAEIVGRNVVSKTLDDRLCVFVMLEALRLLQGKKIPSTLFAVATTQEEVGLRGAVTSAYSLEPNIGIALDVTLANDIPGLEGHNQITELGKGCAIKIMDSSLICHPKLVRHFRDLAEREMIPYQLEILPYGGTDAGGVQRSRGGIPSFTLSIPTRYVHTVNEMANIEDIEGAIRLLAIFLAEAHSRKHGYNAD